MKPNTGRLINSEERMILVSYLNSFTHVLISYVVVHYDTILKVAYTIGNLGFIENYQILEIDGKIRDYKYGVCCCKNPNWGYINMFDNKDDAEKLVNYNKIYNVNYNSSSNNNKNYKLIGINDRKLLSYYLTTIKEVYVAYLIEDWINDIILKIAFTFQENSKELIKEFQLLNVAYGHCDKFKKNITYNANYYTYVKLDNCYATFEEALNELHLEDNEKEFNGLHDGVEIYKNIHGDVIFVEKEKIDHIKEKKNNIRSILKEKSWV